MQFSKSALNFLSNDVYLDFFKIFTKNDPREPIRKQILQQGQFFKKQKFHEKEFRNVFINNLSTLYSSNKKVINFKVHWKHIEISQTFTVEFSIEYPHDATTFGCSLLCATL